MLENVEDLHAAVFQSLGAASTCWEDLGGAGVFKSEKCRAIGDELVQWIEKNYSRTGAQVPYDNS